jgi:hypothetical protein
MEGLIKKQMGGAPQGMGEQMPAGMGMAMEAEDQDEELNENDPAFQAALQLAMKAMYENNAAADIAQALKSAPNPVEGLANTAYEITAVVDEQTDGQVPDELIVMLGITILQEVADIGEAAGVDVSAANVAEAFKQMLLRFLGEQGLDTTQLQQAMDQVDPSVFDKAANAEA